MDRIKSQLTRARLMVRVNPLHPGSAEEVDAVLARGADLVMLPMFEDAATLRAFAKLVAGRCPIVPLLETAGALATLDEWITTPGLWEVYMGLNDLHLSLGQRFMFESLALGLVDRVVVMEFGTLLTQGTPAEIQASPAVRAAYLGTEH